MTRIAIAAVLALSIPAVGLADDRWDHDRTACGHDHRADGWYGAPAPAAPARLDDRRDLARLQVLLARYEQVTAGRRAPAAQRAVESEVLRALDEEIVESRRELRLARGWELRQARAELARIEGIRAEFARLYGRPAPRLVERKHELLAEATRLARRELRQDRGPGAYAATWR